MTSRERRIVTIGLAIALTGFICLRVLPEGVRRWSATRERLAQQRVLLAETRQALTELPRLEDSTRALTRAVGSLAPRILSGTTAPVALSDLSARLSTLTARHHGRLIELADGRDSATAGPLRRVRGVATIETDFQGLSALLLALSRDSLVSVVERIQVQAAEPMAGPSAPERLSVEIRVTAWFLARGRSS
jgi:hypothetical protein